MRLPERIRSTFKDERYIFALPGFRAPAAAGILTMLFGGLGMLAAGGRAFQGSVIDRGFTPSVEQQASIYQARLLWVVSATMLCLAMVASIWWSRSACEATCDTATVDTWKRVTRRIAFLALVVALGVSVCDSYCGDTGLWGILHTFSHGPWLVLAIHVIDGCAAIPMIYICMAAGLLAHASTTTTKRSAAPELQRVVSGLRALLYIAGATLACGVIEVLALYNMFSTVEYVIRPGGLITPAAVLALGRALALAIGIGFSTYLTATYVPTVLQLRRSAARLALAELPDADYSSEERHAWLREHGLVLSPARAASRVLVLLGPVLTALLSGPVLDLVAKVATRELR